MGILANKGQLTADQLVEHGAQRIQITARIDALTFDVLRRHVGRRAEELAGGGDVILIGNAAMPKSQRTTLPWSRPVPRIMMFSGLMSRCTTPCRWASEEPARSGSRSSRRPREKRGRCWFMWARRVGPSMNSVTRKLSSASSTL